jgi:hypothetical protein
LWLHRKLLLDESQFHPTVYKQDSDFRNADNFFSVLMLETGAGDWMRRVILLGVRLLPIVLQRPLLVRCEGVVDVLILMMLDELLSHTHLTRS